MGRLCLRKELRHSLEDQGPGLGMGDVAAAGNEMGLPKAAHPGKNRLNLGGAAVLVILALDHEDGGLDGREPSGDVPVSPGGRAPDLLPAPEEGVHPVAVVARESLPEWATGEVRFRPLEPLEGDLLQEDMGGLAEDGPGHLREFRGEEEGDGAAIAVPDQHRGINVERGEELGQHGEGLMLQVVRGPRTVEGF